MATTNVASWAELSAAAADSNCDEIILTTTIYIPAESAPISFNSARSSASVVIRSDDSSRFAITAPSAYNQNAFNIDGVAVTFSNITLADFHQTDAATISVTNGGSYALVDYATITNTVDTWDNLRNAVNRGSNDITLTKSFSVNTGNGIEIGGDSYGTGKDAASSISIHSSGNNKFTVTGTGVQNANQNAFTISGSNAVTLKNLKLADFSSTTPTLNVTGTGSFDTTTGVTEGYVTWNGLNNAIQTHADASEFVLLGDMTTNGSPIEIGGSDDITITIRSETGKTYTITGTGATEAGKNAFTITGDKSATLQNVVFKNFCSSTSTLYADAENGATGRFTSTNVVDGVGSWDALRAAVNRGDSSIIVLNDIDLNGATDSSPIEIGAAQAANMTIQSQSGHTYTIKGTGSEDAATNAFTITGSNQVAVQYLIFSDFCSPTSTLYVDMENGATGSFTTTNVVDGFSSWDTLRSAVNRGDSDIIVLGNIDLNNATDSAPIEIGTAQAAAVTVQSKSGQNYTITGTGNTTAGYNAFAISDGKTVTLQNVKLTNFKSETPTIKVTGNGTNLYLTNAEIFGTAGNFSTGIYMGPGTTLNAVGTKFTYLIASTSYESHGGAIYSDGASINIVGVDDAKTFEYCATIGSTEVEDQIANGGSIYANGGSLTISNAKITDGSGTQALEGGGIYAINARVTLTNVNFSSLGAVDCGGVICIKTTTPSTLGEDEYDATITKCTIDGTDTEGAGAGVYIGANSKVLMQGTEIKNCVAVGYGGGIYNAGTLYIKNITETINGKDENTENFINDNIAEEGGGGIYNTGFLQMEASTVYNNKAIDYGAGIYNSGTLRIFNSLVCHNERAYPDSTSGDGIYSDNTVTSGENTDATSNDGSNYSFLMVNCTVAEHDAGSGIVFSAPDSAKDRVFNSLIVNNKLDGALSNVPNSDSIDIQYSLYDDDEKTDLFVNTTDHDYHLNPDAADYNAVLNAGSNALYNEYVTGVLSPGDFENNKRFQIAGDVSANAAETYENGKTYYEANTVLVAKVDLGAFEVLGNPEETTVETVTDLASLKQAILDVKYNYVVNNLVNTPSNDPQETTIVIPVSLANFEETLNLDSLAIANDQTFFGAGNRIGVPLVFQFANSTDAENNPVFDSASSLTVATAPTGARHFRINAEDPNNVAPITISDVTLTGGKSLNNGGSTFIEKGAELVLNNVAFTNNTAKNGGAINNYGTLTMNGGSFGDGTTENANSATRFGGAYFGCGAATFNGVSFSSNTAQTGGAIYSQSRGFVEEGDNQVDWGAATVILKNNGEGDSAVYCSFTGNTATGTADQTGFGNGGAIANFGEMTITGGSFGTSESPNTAIYLGGAIMNGTGAELTLSGVTFTSNSVGDKTKGYGGAISNAGTLNITSGVFNSNSATQNGGAIASSGTLAFDRTSTATTFGNNSALDFGGAVVSTGTLSFGEGTNNPTFEGNNSLSGTTPHAFDFANGNKKYLPDVADYITVDSGVNRIYNYNYGSASSALPLTSSLPLDFAGLAGPTTVLLDTKGDGVYEEVSWISPSELGLGVGENVLNIRLVDSYGTTTESELTLNVVAVAPTTTVAATELADGQILKLAIEVSSASPVPTWIIHWGDGTSDKFASYATALNAVHYYAPGSEAGSFDVSLESIDANDVAATYFLLTHRTPANVAADAVFSNAATPNDDLIAPSQTSDAAAPDFALSVALVPTSAAARFDFSVAKDKLSSTAPLPAAIDALIPFFDEFDETEVPDFFLEDVVPTDRPFDAESLELEISEELEIIL